jgi:peptidoglycan hydrolase-like protein with peptidoglycan-binding domain
MSRRPGTMVVLCLIAIAVIVAGVALSGQIRSRQQGLADAEPPEPTRLTAPVEFRVLTSSIVTRGVVGAATVVDIRPSPPADAQPIVTALRYAAGEEIEAGSVLLEIAGRPVIALEGDVPAYRDLLPGADGADVEALQAALESLGFAAGASGVFDAATKSAVDALYTSLGYRPAVHGDPAELAGAERAVTEAERAVATVQSEVDRLAEVDPPDAAAVADAELRLTWARDDLETVRADRDTLAAASGPKVPMSEIVYLPDFPSRVDTVSTHVGAVPDAAVMTVSSGELTVRAKVGPTDRPLIETGMAAEAYSELDGITVPCTVTAIGELADDGNGATAHDVVLTPTDGSFDAAQSGRDVRVTVESAATPAEVLVVPITALFSGTDGAITVIKVLPDDTTERIAVTVGATGNGFVEVRPDGELAQGDEVVVGGQVE